MACCWNSAVAAASAAASAAARTLASASPLLLFPLLPASLLLLSSMLKVSTFLTAEAELVLGLGEGGGEGLDVLLGSRFVGRGSQLPSLCSTIS